jgi:hypothetical protein
MPVDIVLKDKIHCNSFLESFLTSLLEYFLPQAPEVFPNKGEELPSVGLRGGGHSPVLFFLGVGVLGRKGGWDHSCEDLGLKGQ